MAVTHPWVSQSAGYPWRPPATARYLFAEIEATGATSAGAFTPANSLAPWDDADLVGVTASPATAWTGSQHITLRDGSNRKWNGTAWVAYP